MAARTHDSERDAGEPSDDALAETAAQVEPAAVLAASAETLPVSQSSLERDASGGSASVSDPVVGVDTDATLASAPGAARPDTESIFEGLGKGARLDRFVVIDKLGEGGMGVVLVAYDPDLDRKVAIKLLRSGAWDTGVPDEGRQRLLREAQAMAKLSHPNVVVVHGVGTVDNRVYIAMEYVDGCTLGAWCKQEQRSWRDIVAIYCRAGRGLAAAHEAGLVHRDFKPDNVLVGGDGRVRVTDFGIVGTAGAIAPDDGAIRTPESLSSSTPLSVPLTHVGVLLGTPIYMAPEQLERRPADARADQFSFCVALYEALYGERPFAGKSYDELSENVTTGSFRSPRSDAGVPTWVRAILLRGLSADPDQRFPSMTALIDTLEHDPVAARRRRLAVVATAAGFVVLIGAAVVGLVRSTRVVDPAEQCRARSRAGLDAAWSPARRAALERGFAATGAPYADNGYAGVATALDRRAEEISAMRLEACEATRVRGEQSDTMLARRDECIDRRISEMGALIQVLAEQPGAAAVARAPGAVDRLPAVAWCGDLDALATEVEPPAPAIEDRVEMLQARLDRVSALDATGDRGAARAEAEQIAAAARDLRYRPLMAAALYRLGVTQEAPDTVAAAEATLREAVQLAAQAKDDRLVARIWIELVDVVGGRPDRFDEAMALRTTADAAVARAGDHPVDRAALCRVVADLLFEKGQHEQAIAEARAALAALDKARGPDSLAVADASLRLGAMLEASDPQAALVAYRRALEIREASLGSHHPAVAEAAFAMARVLAATGEPSAAVGSATRAREIYAAAAQSEQENRVAAWIGEQQGDR